MNTNSNNNYKSNKCKNNASRIQRIANSIVSSSFNKPLEANNSVSLYSNTGTCSHSFVNNLNTNLEQTQNLAAFSTESNDGSSESTSRKIFSTFKSINPVTSSKNLTQEFNLFDSEKELEIGFIGKQETILNSCYDPQVSYRLDGKVDGQEILDWLRFDVPLKESDSHDSSVWFENSESYGKSAGTLYLSRL